MKRATSLINKARKEIDGINIVGPDHKSDDLLAFNTAVYHFIIDLESTGNHPRPDPYFPSRGPWVRSPSPAPDSTQDAFGRAKIEMWRMTG